MFAGDAGTLALAAPMMRRVGDSIVVMLTEMKCVCEGRCKRPGSGFRVPGTGLRASGFGFRASGSGLRVPDFMPWEEDSIVVMLTEMKCVYEGRSKRPDREP